MADRAGYTLCGDAPCEAAKPFRYCPIEGCGWTEGQCGDLTNGLGLPCVLHDGQPTPGDGEVVTWPGFIRGLDGRVYRQCVCIPGSCLPARCRLCPYWKAVKA